MWSPWHYDKLGKLLSLEEYYKVVAEQKNRNDKKARWLQFRDDTFRLDEQRFIEKWKEKSERNG